VGKLYFIVQIDRFLSKIVKHSFLDNILCKTLRYQEVWQFFVENTLESEFFSVSTEGFTQFAILFAKTPMPDFALGTDVIGLHWQQKNNSKTKR